MKNILVLCVGNICRSPLAQALLQRELPSTSVSSAGLSALTGSLADPMSVQIAQENGLDLSGHRAQQVTSILCKQAELILVMEQSHKAQLESLNPSVRGKVFLLGHYGPFDIPDPYRLDRSAFDFAYQGISQGVADWRTRILQLS
jgi:protein-tyrosine phosphatase